ncbi:SDR family NAD(P)-dependent oxidoreductase [Nocardioides campestrisoli]|uniref:SDR family NAD(P)-dependent oxidoreductase n=1 Tax=Nocardioides campestrisoli TaxID=2736757 RepID=UPI00163D6DA1|nr:SDR family NAD(P)-dependent oxidoreductase [Nocardioides campestrisoli]
MRTLDGKVVAITGAASGIGRALAVEAAGRGAALALSDVDEAGLAETGRVATGVGAREVLLDRVDVSDRDAVAAWADRVAEHFGRVNVVVNNAGVALAGDFTDLDPGDMEWIMGINFWGVVHGTRSFLPHLIASGDGHVVNLSSLFGLMSMPGQSLYCAAKYAVRGMSEALREELIVAGHPVGVTVVHPGGIRTAIARNARVADPDDKQRTADFFDRKLARTDAEEAARVILDGMLAGKARVLVGADAHAMHHLAKTLGSRYQDLVARVARRALPARTKVV